jgi:7,8-dihydropterin-6-yl-methyl-4-(beta-D-ribofuranosyl)aminobenzene 5'-phosphate synthase
VEPPAKLENLGSVPRLSILPLVEFYLGEAGPAGAIGSAKVVGSAGVKDAADRSGLVGESGVSYLVTAGDTQILFDVGCNELDEDPSPLMRNMRTLGISASDVDAVFISHCHLDHVGGRQCAARRTFALSPGLVDLNGIPAYVPTPMTHSSAKMEYVSGPRRLGEGLASTGPLNKAIWLVGPVAEQSLLVNVEGKGPVMIVGCGHPSLPRLVERAQAVAGEPLYGILGGLHFPVTGSRVGKGRQNIIGNGKLPWQRITRTEAREAAAYLDSLGLSFVALSAHDSCDWTLGVFQEILGDRYSTLRVGEEIVIA